MAGCRGTRYIAVALHVLQSRKSGVANSQVRDCASYISTPSNTDSISLLYAELLRRMPSSVSYNQLNIHHARWHDSLATH